MPFLKRIQELLQQSSGGDSKQNSLYIEKQSRLRYTIVTVTKCEFCQTKGDECIGRDKRDIYERHDMA